MAWPLVLAQDFNDPVVQMRLLLAVSWILLFIMLGYLVKGGLTLYIRKVAQRTKTNLDDFFFHAIHPPAVLIFLTVGFWLGFREASVVIPAFKTYEFVFFIILAALVAYTIGRVIASALLFVASKRPRLDFLAHLGRRVAYLVLFIIAALIVLGEAGVEITPLLASLGIAGIAVALALQDTLGNLFAGLWVQTGRIIRPGNYVKVEDINQEGWVTEVSWRSTRILTRKNNLVAIPNTKIASSVVTNYDLPTPDQWAIVNVGVSYNSDVDQVQRILAEVNDWAINELPNTVKNPPPLVRFDGFGDSSLDFLILVRVKRYVDQFEVIHHLRNRIIKEFNAAGIEIPYPHRTVYLRQEQAEKAMRLAMARGGTEESPAA